MTALRYIVLAAAIFAACAMASTSTPAGYPHIDFTVTAPNYNETDVKTNLAAWLSFNTGLGTKYGSAVNGSAIYLYDSAVDTDDYSMNFTLQVNGMNNVEAYFAMESLRDALESNSVLGDSAAYSTVFAHLHENPATSVEYNVDPMSVVYQYQTSPTYIIRLSASARIGRNVTFHISPVAGTVQFNASRVVIPWPSLEGYFHANAGDTVTTCGVGFDSISGSDDASRFSPGSSVNTEVMTVRALETVSVTSVPLSQRLYTNQPSPVYTLNVPQHRDPNFELIVTPIISPTTAVADPVNITIRTPNTPATFTISGSTGVYDISYLIGHVYEEAGRTYGRSNPDFEQIDTTSRLYIQPTMNVTSSSIPDAYLVNPVTSADYGGAYSQSIPVHIEEDPVTGRNLIVTPSSPTPGLEFSPSSIQFFPGGVRMFTFQYRAPSIGIHYIDFALSGSGAGDYYMPLPRRRWIVHGRNPRCLVNSAEGPCFEMPGCTWNAQRSVCANGTLPIGIDSIPLLYDQEESASLNFTLPTPLRSNLRVTFEPSDSRLAFTPPSVLLGRGDTTASFTITSTLLSGDVGNIRSDFKLRLTENDANMFDEQEGYLFSRPKVQCTVTTPATGFFVNTLSELFVINCDTSPETEVVFTPSSSMSGIIFIAEFPDARGSDRLYFSPGQTSARFYANSTSDQKGTSTLAIAISGVNGPRYEPINAVTFRVIESGFLNPPATFHMTAYEYSDMINLDLSVPPPEPLNVTILVYENGTDVRAESSITIEPNEIMYNQSARGMFRVYANAPGWYEFGFLIEGANVRNYLSPTMRAPFEAKDPLSGRAFDARLRPGFLGHRKQCRVSVGRQSTTFRGQAPVDRTTEFCQQHPSQQRFANETYDCSQLATEERCRWGLDTLGHACAWHQNSCQFVQEMQGNILGYAYGSGFVVFLSLAGEVWTIGVDRYGQLGHSLTTVGRVPVPENVAVIAAGSNHIMALTYMGNVYTWGANQNGQLGQNTRTAFRIEPGLVTFPRGENITCISSGTLHLAALSQSGRLFTWGNNQYGQLGTRAQYRSYATGPIPLGRDVFNGDAVIAVTLGEFHSMAATEEGAYTWGSNTMGQLGRVAYDDYEPKEPTHWVRDRWTSAPSYASYLLGRDCPAN